MFLFVLNFICMVKALEDFLRAAREEIVGMVSFCHIEISQNYCIQILMYF